MTATDTVFAGSIPAIYDRYMVPLLFRPYARVSRERAAKPGTAARSSKPPPEPASSPRRCTARCPMRRSSRPISTSRCSTSAASACAVRERLIPTGRRARPAVRDASFDLVVCQFGVMFYPDKVRGQCRSAPRAARRRPLSARDLGRVERNLAHEGRRHGASPSCFPTTPPLSMNASRSATTTVP